MALASVAFDVARSKLNDVAATRWTDAVLLSFIQQAHRELQVKLDLEGIPVINAASVAMTVPALTTDLSTVTGYPTDLVKPEWMKEKQVGEPDQNYIDMGEKDFVPQEQQGVRLRYWVWIGEKIQLLGSVNATVAYLRYWRGLPAIASGSTALGFLYAENYVGPRAAALAGDSVGDDTGFDRWTTEAMSNLSDIIRMNVKGLQNLPARRMGYHRRGGARRMIRGI